MLSCNDWMEKLGRFIGHECFLVTGFAHPRYPSAIIYGNYELLLRVGKQRVGRIRGDLNSPFWCRVTKGRAKHFHIAYGDGAHLNNDRGIFALIFTGGPVNKKRYTAKWYNWKTLTSSRKRTLSKNQIALEPPFSTRSQ